VQFFAFGPNIKIILLILKQMELYMLLINFLNHSQLVLAFQFLPIWKLKQLDFII